MKSGSRIYAVTAAAMLAAASLTAAAPVRASEAPLPLEMPRSIATSQAPAAGAVRPERATTGAAPISAAAADASATPSADTARFPDLREMNLTLAPPAGLRSEPGDPAIDPTAALQNERAVVPVPSPAWTGFTGLAVLGLIGSRKAILRFVS